MSTHENDIYHDPYVPESVQRHRRSGLEQLASAPLDRRNFIKLTGFAGGGLVLGLSLTPARQSKAQAADGAAVLGPYVQIAEDGTIILFSKNPEVGQGVKTSMPMIVAEELDADWNTVRVEQSRIDASVYGQQFAGGSLSIPTNWGPLRQAGATARAMLVSAASAELGVPESELRTEDSFVIHASSNRRIAYGDLAAAAAAMPVPGPQSLRMKDRSEYRLLGRRITGVDNEAIVTGKPLFGIDTRLPDMVYATYVKGPAIGARPASANLDEIRARPGVIDAFIIEGRGNPIEFGVNAAAILPGIAIVANSTWTAFKAAEALVVDWDESDAASDSWSAQSATAQQLGAGEGSESLTDQGDVDAAMNSARATAEGFYTYQYASHADLEPQNCTAWYRDGKMEIWAPTQMPQGAVQAVSAMLDLPEDQITLHQLRGGGGFGRRLANDSVVEVAEIARRIGRPVKAQWMREDDMGFDYYRPGGFHSFKGAIDSEGRLSAWQDHFITFARPGGALVSSANLSPQEFPANALSNVRVTQSKIDSGIPTGPWRAPGSNAIAFAIQCFMNECAVAANRDHLEFLLEVIGRISPPAAGRGGFGGFGGGGLNAERATNVIELAAREAGWGGQLPAGRGRGLAFHFSHQGHFAEVAEVSVDSNRNVTVHRVTVAGDIGPVINMSGAENQVQGSVIDGISTAMGLEITFEGGRVEQRNFDRYPLLRISQAPVVDVHFIQSDNSPTGCGEPALPPAAPALANAIFAATGNRVRTMPFTRDGYRINTA